MQIHSSTSAINQVKVICIGLLCLIFSFGFFLTCLSQASIADTIRAELSKKSIDTVLVLNMFETVENGFDFNQKKDVVTLLPILQEHKFDRGIAIALLIKGSIDETEGQIFEALDNYQLAHQLGVHLADTGIIARALNCSGRVYKNSGDRKKALDYFNQSLANFEKINDLKGTATALSNIGVMYMSQGESDKAHNFYDRSLSIRTRINDVKGIAESYQNISTCFDPKNDFDTVLKCNLYSMKLRETIGDKNGIAHAQSNIGMLYHTVGNYEKALEYLNASFKIYNELRNEERISRSLNNLAIIYRSMNRMSDAETFAKKSLEVATSHGLNERIKSSAELLQGIYASQNDYKNAYQMQKLSNSMDKVLDNAEVKKTIARLEFEKKESLIRVEQAKKDAIVAFKIQRQKSIRNWIVAVSIITIVFVTALIFLVMQRREIALNLQVSDSRMKAMTAQLNQHFIFSSLISIQAYMRDNFDKADDYLARFAKFVRTILNNSEKKIITLKQELEETENYMILERLRLQEKFNYRLILENDIDPEEYFVPPLLFQPIVENSIKHGFSEIEYNSEIIIRIFRKNNMLICELSDNGRGLSPSKKSDPNRKSFGTKLTQERIQMFNKMNNQKAFYKIEQLTLGVKTTLNIPILN